MDEEIFFGRDLLVDHSPYIEGLVQDLDPNKVSSLRFLYLIIECADSST